LENISDAVNTEIVSANITSSTNVVVDEARAKSNNGGLIEIAAIDNGLAFPFKHPDEWRACN